MINQFIVEKIPLAVFMPSITCKISSGDLMLQYFRYKIGFGFECTAEILSIEKIRAFQDRYISRCQWLFHLDL